MTAITPVGFWFLRHGETDWNARDLSQGRTDVPLNARGLEQAGLAAERMAAAEALHAVVRVVSSPLIRARVTAETVAARLGLAVTFDEDLQEVNFGEQEGLKMGAWYDDWIAGDYTPAGAEPFATLRERAVAGLNRALAGSAPVLVVAHGGLFRAVRSAMGLQPNVRTANAHPIWCEPAWTLHPV